MASSQLYAEILPHLPPVLQDLLLNPPSLSRPQSFFPVIKALIPYTQYLIVIVAFYIVWTTLRSLSGFVFRILRFSLKLGPILALISWAMSNSGQGGMDEVFQAVKEYAGLAPARGGARSPGLAGLFGGQDPVSGRTRSKNQSKNKKKTAAAGGGSAEDILASMLNSATGGAVGAGAGGGDGGLGDVVGKYVKNALAKAAGVDWLFGDGEQQGAGAGRTR